MFQNHKNSILSNAKNQLRCRIKTRFQACLSNCITREAIVPQSCSNPENTRQVFQSAMKKNYGVAKWR